MQIGWFACVAAAGCGRVGFTALANDAVVDDAVITDYTQPFSAPFALEALDYPTADEDDISLTGDLLEVYFMSDRSGTELLYKATRLDASAMFGAPVTVDELNTANINNARVRSDGLALYFASSRGASAAQDLWVSVRANREATWDPPQRIVELATADDEFEPYPSPDGLSIYYTSRVSGEGELFTASRTNTSGLFGLRTELTTLNAPLYEGGSWIDATGLHVMFHSNRSGDIDLYRASRLAAELPFEAPVPISELNVVGVDDEDPWMSPDGRTIAFASKRSGDGELYMAQR